MAKAAAWPAMVLSTRVHLGNEADSSGLMNMILVVRWMERGHPLILSKRSLLNRSFGIYTQNSAYAIMIKSPSQKTKALF